ncbi:hypothetical protein NFHSH190041_37270 (plasmid) [Shewanella sp. NFH-SH190041]|uniref:MobV family relaxase n=1 Tax=Shewanella sp. NFH-SH190041 TaxID=2950245 RepID=UPI0021C45E25|nr:MobV family relaxase [Shewanella sp. NFH-SH190041]BDM66275.1 hypothetical protein NFHSH190041_37270 [Shewanella sp. NFH-SH190041]
MSDFCIMRTAKLKSLGNIAGSLAHAFRERQTLNADQNRQHRNINLGGKTANEVMLKIKSMLPEKRRKDAVLAIEYLFTASPEIMNKMTLKEQREYFKDCLKWLKTNYGEDNLVFAGIHEDETTPHCYAYVLPLDNGKLNAKKWLGGRKKLSDMQSHFHQNVGAKFGMNRGLKGSKAKHQTVKKYYDQVNHISQVPAPEKPTNKQLLAAATGFNTEWLDQLLSTAKSVPSLQNQIKLASELRRTLALQQVKLDTRESEIGNIEMMKGKLIAGLKQLERDRHQVNQKLSESDSKHAKDIHEYQKRVQALEAALNDFESRKMDFIP